jgi:hypothetical protein
MKMETAPSSETSRIPVITHLIVAPMRSGEQGAAWRPSVEICLTDATLARGV